MKLRTYVPRKRKSVQAIQYDLNNQAEIVKLVKGELVPGGIIFDSGGWSLLIVPGNFLVKSNTRKRNPYDICTEGDFTKQYEPATKNNS